MHPKAIEKARSRLRVARKALHDMQASNDMEAFHDSWYTFLTATKNIYECLKTGANTTTPQSRQWYGEKARERREDPLLQYVYEARNADEHGLASSVVRRNASVAIGVRRPGYTSSISVKSGPDGSLRVTSNDDKPILFETRPAHVVLVPVTARGNRIHPPPAQHLGKPIDGSEPIPVAEHALNYLEALVEEASKLA